MRLAATLWAALLLTCDALQGNWTKSFVKYAGVPTVTDKVGPYVLNDADRQVRLRKSSIVHLKMVDMCSVQFLHVYEVPNAVGCASAGCGM